jgi:acetoin:2,6-dichlorophenolindophenol oxidoreductase subunit alpha
VWDAFGEFLAEARTGRGPFLLECLTYRLRAHYEGDHRAGSRDEFEAKDPIARLDPDGSFDASAIEAEVERAVQLARESPFPPRDLIERLVYADA